MCMIVDNDRMDVFLTQRDHNDIKPIYQWLEKSGNIVYSTGTTFATELSRKAKIGLQELKLSGRAQEVSDSGVKKEIAKLSEKNVAMSNDLHILALARVSGARLLHTGDLRLMQDFKNRDIIKGPRGKVYSGQQNTSLLKQNVCAN